MRSILGVLVTGGALIVALTVGSASSAAPLSGQVVKNGSGWTCNAAVDLDLVKVTDPGGDAVTLAAGCSGRIGRVEVDTWQNDGVKIKNAGSAAHDLEIQGGYVTCHDIEQGAHQDAVQAMGGQRITFVAVTFDCLGNSNFFVNRGGSGNGTPTDIVCDGCSFAGRSSTTVRVGSSVRSGVRNSRACVGRNVGQAYLFLSSAVAPVNEGNVVLSETDPLCSE